ncbi:MAG TPA: serine--tRNA ligase [Candidatus Thermoplasmatota archaeon]|nr:serine--tRNA ligase [Candidatus Thermoplasmatota archaeon]
MLDIRLIREKPETVRDNLARRQDAEVLARFEEIRTVDRQWREATSKVERVRADRNKLAAEIGQAKKAGHAPSPDTVARSQALPKELEAAETTVEALRLELDRLAMRLPNLLHESVPFGKDDSENQVVATWGAPRENPSAIHHGELAERLGLADFERAAKIAGSGFAFLKGDLALLDLSLQRFALDLLAERGFTPVLTPVMMRRAPYEGVTDLADFEKVMYKIEGEDLYLVATSEHPLGGMFAGEILDEDALPLRLAGISPCFRREIGAHGVDTRGLFRMHQFNKIEQFVFCDPDDSWAIHEEIRQNAEEIFRRLAIPYRVVNVCTGDIGTVAAKKYDIEAWSPRQRKYIEVVSCSNCTDYQARRLKIRAGKAGGDKRVAHTLNSTAVATSRALVAILENGQRDDGTVEVPAALRPYLGKDTLGASLR